MSEIQYVKWASGVNVCWTITFLNQNVCWRFSLRIFSAWIAVCIKFDLIWFQISKSNPNIVPANEDISYSISRWPSCFDQGVFDWFTSSNGCKPNWFERKYWKMSTLFFAKALASDIVWQVWHGTKFNCCASQWTQMASGCYIWLVQFCSN